VPANVGTQDIGCLTPSATAPCDYTKANGSRVFGSAVTGFLRWNPAAARVAPRATWATAPRCTPSSAARAATASRPRQLRQRPRAVDQFSGTISFLVGAATASTTGSATGVLTVVNNGTGCVGTVLAAGKTCSIQVRYAPTAAVTSNGTVTVTGDSTSLPASVSASLNGTGK